MKILISIVIITRNRSFILGDCLKALHPQVDFSKHEVIVVDSSEKDDTAFLIKNFPWVNYHRITLPLGTRPQSYSYGGKISKGEIVALLDDDAIVFPGWLERIEAAYADSKIGAAGGRVLGREDVQITEEQRKLPVGLINSKGRIFSNLFIDTGRTIEIDVLRGCNMSVRRDLLEKMPYFDSRFRGQNCRVEDDICLWVKRMGYKVLYDPQCTVRHLAEERPDVPRSEYNATSEFYVWRNTAWLYAKHFGLTFETIFFVGIKTPVLTCLRRVLSGSFKNPRITRESLRYLPASAAGIWGGLWGLMMSVLYLLNDKMFSQKSLPKIGKKGICVLGDKAALNS